jgi:hypothetical protein
LVFWHSDRREESALVFVIPTEGRNLLWFFGIPTEGRNLLWFLSFRPKGGICFGFCHSDRREESALVFVIPTEGRNLLSSTLSATEKARSLHVSSTQRMVHAAVQADTVPHLSTVFHKPNRTSCDEQPLPRKTGSAHSHCARESETEQQRDLGFRPTNF